MSSTRSPDRDPIDRELVTWGKAIVLETRGRSSGRPRQVVIGFAEDAGALLVAAADDTTHWALNLEADARCRVDLGAGLQPYTASRLDGADRAAVITALILKYGTPAERQGRGPAFRLVPDDRPDRPGDAEALPADQAAYTDDIARLRTR